MTGITRMNWVAMMTRIISNNNNNNNTKCFNCMTIKELQYCKSY